ncbi:unnamed protein product [Notodromas monacha]|uniref:Chitin-binding type-2 domain-containing protein n=1 Tax=Notodromas monacha TaxID=399045 RepID=A0A7R9GDH0_9CRUS|nr:unnamed protein product [Notodromas monacha]CAG0918668.1 unnamed protein product [Notodromas monacha]
MYVNIVDEQSPTLLKCGREKMSTTAAARKMFLSSSAFLLVWLFLVVSTTTSVTAGEIVVGNDTVSAAGNKNESDERRVIIVAAETKPEEDEKLRKPDQDTAERIVVRLGNKTVSTTTSRTSSSLSGTTLWKPPAPVYVVNASAMEPETSATPSAIVSKFDGTSQTRPPGVITHHKTFSFKVNKAVHNSNRTRVFGKRKKAEDTSETIIPSTPKLKTTRTTTTITSTSSTTTTTPTPITQKISSEEEADAELQRKIAEQVGKLYEEELAKQHGTDENFIPDDSDTFTRVSKAVTKNTALVSQRAKILRSGKSLKLAQKPKMHSNNLHLNKTSSTTKTTNGLPKQEQQKRDKRVHNSIIRPRGHYVQGDTKPQRTIITTKTNTIPTTPLPPRRKEPSSVISVKNAIDEDKNRGRKCLKIKDGKVVCKVLRMRHQSIDKQQEKPLVDEKQNEEEEDKQIVDEWKLPVPVLLPPTTHHPPLVLRPTVTRVPKTRPPIQYDADWQVPSVPQQRPPFQHHKRPPSSYQSSSPPPPLLPPPPPPQTSPVTPSRPLLPPITQYQQPQLPPPPQRTPNFRIIPVQLPPLQTMLHPPPPPHPHPPSPHPHPPSSHPHPPSPHQHPPSSHPHPPSPHPHPPSPHPHPLPPPHPHPASHHPHPPPPRPHPSSPHPHPPPLPSQYPSPAIHHQGRPSAHQPPSQILRPPPSPWTSDNEWHPMVVTPVRNFLQKPIADGSHPAAPVFPVPKQSKVTYHKQHPQEYKLQFQNQNLHLPQQLFQNVQKHAQKENTRDVFGTKFHLQPLSQNTIREPEHEHQIPQHGQQYPHELPKHHFHQQQQSNDNLHHERPQFAEEPLRNSFQHHAPQHVRNQGPPPRPPLETNKLHQHPQEGSRQRPELSISYVEPLQVVLAPTPDYHLQENTLDEKNPVDSPFSKPYFQPELTQAGVDWSHQNAPSKTAVKFTVGDAKQHPLSNPGRYLVEAKQQPLSNSHQQSSKRPFPSSNFRQVDQSPVQVVNHQTEDTVVVHHQKGKVYEETRNNHVESYPQPTPTTIAPYISRPTTNPYVSKYQQNIQNNYNANQNEPLRGTSGQLRRPNLDYTDYGETSSSDTKDSLKVSLLTSGEVFLGIPGRAGVDYPINEYFPETGFSCPARDQYLRTGPGDEYSETSGFSYHADPSTGCQGFHLCFHDGSSPAGFSFLCPNGTVFNDKYLVCDWWYNVRCQPQQQQQQQPSVYHPFSA